MANEQTSVPLFTAGEVLTAANMNISAGTGVPVFSNTTTRDAGFGGAGEKVLAEGQLCYLSDSNIVQYYSGSGWATVGPAAAPTSGLTLISATTIGSAVSSVTVSGAFSATYDYYKITISGGTGSVNDEQLGLKLGATATGYYNAFVGANYAPDATGTYSGNSTNTGTQFNAVGRVMTDGLNLNMELNGPFLAKRTIVSGTMTSVNVGRIYSGYLDGTTSYTAFTITPASGTITGGTIRVYGYANS
jgi:hypothetical protein